MKCPHCEYVYGYDNENPEEVKGTQGDFYKLPVKLERESPYSYYGAIESVPLLGCPNCKKIFLGDKW